MKYGVRAGGSRDRGYARFLVLRDARDFVALVNKGNGEIVNLITGEVIK